MKIQYFNGTTAEHLGFIPHFLNEHSPLSAREQLHRHYAHGGGFDPFPGFKLDANDNLRYPGDPPLRKLAEITLRDERIVVYEGEWVAVIQPDRSFVVARMD